MGTNVILLIVLSCFMCIFYFEKSLYFLDNLYDKYITDTRGEKVFGFIWDSTIAVSEGEMETAMMLLLVHRTTHLTFSKACLPLHRQWALKYLFGKFERLPPLIASFQRLAMLSRPARWGETGLALWATAGWRGRRSCPYSSSNSSQATCYMLI